MDLLARHVCHSERVGAPPTRALRAQLSLLSLPTRRVCEAMAHAAEEPPLAPRLLAATANAWCRGAAALAASAAARGAARAEALSAAMDATEAQLALLEATMDSVGDLAALEAQAAGTRLCLRVWGAVRAHGASGAPRGCWEAQSDNSIAVASSQRTGGEAYPRAAQGAPFAGNDRQSIRLWAGRLSRRGGALRSPRGRTHARDACAVTITGTRDAGGAVPQRPGRGEPQTDSALMLSAGASGGSAGASSADAAAAAAPPGEEGAPSGGGAEGAQGESADAPPEPKEDPGASSVALLLAAERHAGEA